MAKKYEEKSTEVEEKKGNSKPRSKGQGRPNKSKDNKDQGKRGSAALQKNINIINNAASISYFNALGRKLGLSNVNPAAQYVEYTDQRIPGIMVLNYVQGPGIAAGNDDPVNIAADSVYSYNRHMNSGMANYDSNDQMTYMLAAAELYAYWALAVRAIGLINVYDSTNVYLPRVLVEAAGFDFDDLKKNQTKLRGAINTSAAEISSYAVPDIFPYYRRTIDMVSRVYTDRDVLKPQIYLFKPAISRKYSEATSDKGAELIPEKIPSTLTVDVWIARMNELINAFRRSEDCGIISGDLLKAYGRENCVTMPAVDENYIVVPEYDEDWLLQIHNARILTWYGDVSDDEIATFKIWSDVDSGLVKYVPIHRSMLCAQLPPVLDMRKSEPQPWDTIVATRLIPNMQYGFALQEDKRVWGMISSGTEFILHAEVLTITEDGTGIGKQSVVSTLADEDGLTIDLGVLSSITKFNWAPLMFETTVTNPTSSNPHYTVKSIFNEMANYAVISGQNLNEMHRAELLEAFRIPYDGSY